MIDFCELDPPILVTRGQNFTIKLSGEEWGELKVTLENNLKYDVLITSESGAMTFRMLQK